MHVTPATKFCARTSYVDDVFARTGCARATALGRSHAEGSGPELPALALLDRAAPSEAPALPAASLCSSADSRKEEEAIRGLLWSSSSCSCLTLLAASSMLHHIPAPPRSSTSSSRPAGKSRFSTSWIAATVGATHQAGVASQPPKRTEQLGWAGLDGKARSWLQTRSTKTSAPPAVLGRHVRTTSLSSIMSVTNLRAEMAEWPRAPSTRNAMRRPMKGKPLSVSSTRTPIAEKDRGNATTPKARSSHAPYNNP
mmetsp:Transcript_134503/g.251667  ORF Transcript_134503/g.251667 Transcript_134503/m.251667 type:complete len:254 (-) Transcript_134503:360-1121(-)